MKKLYLLYQEKLKNIIIRDIYQRNIPVLLQVPMIKIISGMRRVGKSYFLYQIFQHILASGLYTEQQIFYVNKEWLEFDFIKNYQDLLIYFETWKTDNQIENHFLIAIDEIQEIEGWEKFINSIFSHDPTGNIFITGSNSRLLSSQLSTYIAGRYIQLTIYPLSLNEFALFKNNYNYQNILEEYLIWGGLPAMINIEQADLKDNYLHGVYDSIFIKDIIEYYKLRNINILHCLHKYIFKHSSSLFNGENIVKYLKTQNINTSIETILNYLDYSSSAYLIKELPRFDLVGKKIFVVSKKYYALDIGLRNTICGLNLTTEIGIIFENLVYIHLLRNGWDVYSGQLYDYEIDFFALKQNKKIYIQVAYKLPSLETISREFGNLFKIKDNRPKYVITNDVFFESTYEGIQWINIVDFLINDII